LVLNVLGKPDTSSDSTLLMALWSKLKLNMDELKAEHEQEGETPRDQRT
jgi:hypothetical protein